MASDLPAARQSLAHIIIITNNRLASEFFVNLIYYFAKMYFNKSFHTAKWDSFL